MRVLCGRVGGGFGGKQEMLVEDICALAAWTLRRPVQLELTRAEQFAATTTRHPMRVTARAGARRDGTLTALSLQVVANAGAYGNHSAAVLEHACGAAMAMYRCPNKQVDAVAAYTNTVPAGAFRGYGLSQTMFAVEQAIDALARGLGIDPFTLRRRNMVRPGDALVGAHAGADDVEFGSYGLDQCLDLVEAALRGPGGGAPPDGPGWRVGEGMAMAMIDTAPPGGHRARSAPGAGRRWRVRARGRHGGVRQRHLHRAPAGRRRSCWAPRRTTSVCAAPTPTWSGTTPAPTAAPAWWLRCRRRRWRPPHSRDRVIAAAAARTGAPVETCRLLPGAVSCNGARVPLRELAGPGMAVMRRADATPRSLAFNVHGFRLAVNTGTGEIRILRSVHAADAGRVLNPMQCRGQIEGGVAQALGAALHENVRIDERGAVGNPAFRTYHIPAWADLPPTEVLFADTYDAIGPLGAKSMSESPFDPVAPALANALADATGLRFTATPFTADRVWARCRGGAAPGQPGGVTVSPVRPDQPLAQRPDLVRGFPERHRLEIKAQPLPCRVIDRVGHGLLQHRGEARAAAPRAASRCRPRVARRRRPARGRSACPSRAPVRHC